MTRLPWVNHSATAQRHAMPSVLGRTHNGVAVAIAALALTLGILMSGRRSFAQSSPQDDLAAAAAAERSAHYQDAVRHYQNFLASQSSRSSSAVVEARIGLATAFFMLHRYQESLDALQPLIPSMGDLASSAAGASEPRATRPAPSIPAQASLLRGLDDLELSRPGDVNRLSDATASLRRALELNPASGTARMALGDALARSEHLEEAADEYREQLRRTPKLGDAWYKLGLVYTNLSGKLAAEFARQQAGSDLAIQLTAERLSDGGDYWGAAQALFPIVRSLGSSPIPAKHGQDGHAPFPPGLHATFGTALLQLGYWHAAQREFEAELSHDPESLPAQFGMAEIEALRSNWARALPILRHLMAAYPKELARQLESPPPAALLKVSKSKGFPLPPDLAGSSAGRLWTAWIGSEGLESPPRFDSLPDSGKARCSTPPSSRQREPGYWIPEACAAQLLEDLRPRRDPTENARAKLVEIEYRLGDYDAARTSALALLRLAAGDPWGRYWLAKSYSALAGECFGKLAEVSPDSARVHEILARYHSQRQQLAAARTEYEAALRLEPELPDLHLGLGTVYWQSGDWTRAETELKRALELSPGSGVAAYELGDSYIQQHQWQQAAGCLQRALADPAVERRARLDLAKAQDELGNREEAIGELALLAQDDPDGQIHYRLAMAYRETGETAKARAALATSEALRKISDQLSIERLENLEKEAGQNPEVHPK